MKNKLNIEDKVRFIYPDYFSAMKDDYSQSSNWLKAEENKNMIMIGGEYIVKNIKRKNVFWKYYKIGNCEEWINDAFLIPSYLFQPCPFIIGDKVIFKPKCSKKEISLLMIGNPTLEFEKEYSIVRIINEFYIIIDTPFPDSFKNIYRSGSLPESTKKIMEKYPNLKLGDNEFPEHSLPLRWIDVEKI